MQVRLKMFQAESWDVPRFVLYTVPVSDSAGRRTSGKISSYALNGKAHGPAVNHRGGLIQEY